MFRRRPFRTFSRQYCRGYALKIPQLGPVARPIRRASMVCRIVCADVADFQDMAADERYGDQLLQSRGCGRFADHSLPYCSLRSSQRRMYGAKLFSGHADDHDHRRPQLPSLFELKRQKGIGPAPVVSGWSTFWQRSAFSRVLVRLPQAVLCARSS